MYRNNRIYGNGATLNEFVGQPWNKPIWGEIQHSLDFKLDLLKSLDSPRIVKSFFTWRKKDAEEANRYFGKKWKFTSIGDPFIYQTHKDNLKSGATERTKTLIIPRFQKNLDRRIRIEKHFQSSAHFKTSRHTQFEVTLHPGEINDQEVRDIYTTAEISINEINLFYDRNYLSKEIQTLTRYSEVHSNYIGPTLLRAVYLGAKGFLFGSESSSIAETFGRNLFSTRSSITDEKAYADYMLGSDSILSRIELKEAMESNLGQFATKILQQLKFVNESNYKKLAFSKKIPHIEILCNKCIHQGSCRLLQNMAICGSCGHTLKEWDDFFCKLCSTNNKILSVQTHLELGHSSQ